MAKGKKTGGADFKPGHGKGRPPTPKEILEATKLGKAQFQGIFHRFSLMTYEDFLIFCKAIEC